MIEDESSGLLRVHTKEVYVELEKEKIDRTLEVNKNSITLTWLYAAATARGVWWRLSKQLIVAEFWKNKCFNMFWGSNHVIVQVKTL